MGLLLLIIEGEQVYEHHQKQGVYLVMGGHKAGDLFGDLRFSLIERVEIISATWDVS